MMPRRFLIDTDTASDDAVALVMALRQPDVEVVAITVVAGNVPLEQGVQNALYTVELCGQQVPVHAGAAAPLMRRLETAQNVHGSDGMGDIGLPLRGRTPASRDGVGVLVDAVRQYPNELTVVTLGPLTNLALAVLTAPDIVPLIPRVVMMGGVGQGPGNVTPAAEFNIWVDPEAADIVFASGLPLEMVGWDVSRLYATIDADESAQLRARGPLGEFCTDIQAVLLKFCRETTHLSGYDLPDPIAMAVALADDIATEVVDRYVRVETAGERTRGETVVDHLGVLGEPDNVRVVLAASHDDFLRMLATAMAS
jgi:purine nucleosidase